MHFISCPMYVDMVCSDNECSHEVLVFMQTEEGCVWICTGVTYIEVLIGVV